VASGPLPGSSGRAVSLADLIDVIVLGS